MRKFDPIELLCEILDGLPNGPWGRDAMIRFAAMALGIPQKPTGLPPTPERTLQQQYWDFELSDIRKRLLELVQQTSFPAYPFYEQFLVAGVIQFAKDWLEDQADSDRMETKIGNNKALIEHFEQIKLTPPDARMGDEKMSDDEIDKFLEIPRKAIENMERNRASAESTLDALSTAYRNTFTSDFWSEYLLIRSRGT